MENNYYGSNTPSENNTNHSAHPVNKKKKSKKKARTQKLIALGVLVALAAFIIGIAIWTITFVHRIKNPTFTTSTPSPSAAETPYNPGHTIDPSVTPEPTPPDITIDVTPRPKDSKKIEWGKDVLNIIVLGYDESEERDSFFSSFRTDTMILCTIYFNEKRVTLTSIPRDSYVLIGEAFEDKDKINSVPFYAKKQGIDTYKAICSTVSRLFGGVPVDYYIAINMDVFVEVIDAIGGIEYDVDVEVAYTSEEWGKITLVEKGLQVLDGEKALAYVQFRGTATADIGRVERQRKFISAAFNQMKSLGTITKLPSIYNIVKDNVKTNFSYADLVSLATFAATELDTSSIKGATFPGFYLTKDGISYWGINQRERLYYIYDLFGITAKAEVQD